MNNEYSNGWAELLSTQAELTGLKEYSFHPLRPAHRAHGPRLLMSMLTTDTDRSQPVSALSALLRRLNLMYDYSQNYSSSLAQKHSDPFQRLAYLGPTRNKSPLIPTP